MSGLAMGSSSIVLSGSIELPSSTVPSGSIVLSGLVMVSDLIVMSGSVIVSGSAMVSELTNVMYSLDMPTLLVEM